MAKYNILLVKNDNDLSWLATLNKAMEGIADITILSEKKLLQETQYKKFDLILIHTVSITDVIQIIKSIKRNIPLTPILVVTASPDPEVARSVFLAGAADYISESVDELEIRDDLLKTIKHAKRE